MTTPGTVSSDAGASDLPGRLFDALVSEIRERWPEYLHARFTVAEIYQNLIPWRTHRDAMGVATSAEYERALLRLLAGEGDRLALESEPAREEIRTELESGDPDTGLYRDFAAVGVRLNPSRVPVRDEAEPRGADAAAEARPDGGAAAGAICSGCDREMPSVDGVRFCPFCGQDVRVVACAECGMRIETEWFYCVGCGRRARRA